MLDAYFAKHSRFSMRLYRYYSEKSDEELCFIRAHLIQEQHMLGNVPLLASTMPIVFLIFGSQLGKYFPHDSLSWVIAAMVSILIIVWSINHNFRHKSRVHLDLYLIEEIQKARSQNSPRPVQ
ncbi:hypothetical protein [Tumebacillus permanentifrigoris]|uniref:Uncharacterized protein n=1 Tax=Tumebacillus permanentifrigoris TaxID=378543 RepID=A0A316D8E0_9BACL|nr:hypothetical protein [Tumebacillus permanentifrigoris]PWK06628.1 hypothetical protein C7459_11951 [Tumebacillus permanentifrigoris]